jgi:hypothetical protein
MEVIDVTIVLDAGVPTARAVLVRVIRMSRSHCPSPSSATAFVRRPQQIQFVGVRPLVMDQVGDVPIHQSVREIRSLPSPGDQPLND